MISHKEAKCSSSVLNHTISIEITAVHNKINILLLRDIRVKGKKGIQEGEGVNKCSY